MTTIPTTSVKFYLPPPFFSAFSKKPAEDFAQAEPCIWRNKRPQRLVHSPLTELSLSPTICFAMKAAITEPGPRDETRDVGHYTAARGLEAAAAAVPAAAAVADTAARLQWGWIDVSSQRLPQANYRYPLWTRVDALSLIKPFCRRGSVWKRRKRSVWGRSRLR